MLRTLIVDDEPPHIHGLVRYIRWNELGYEAPLTAESGQEALDILLSTQIDVLITDVSMPIMTGIELVDQAKTLFPNLQVLMISGYNEFEFVQDAINVGAQAFVLKPIKIEEVESKLTFFGNTLRNFKQIEEQMIELQEKVSGSIEFVRERFVTDVIGGGVVENEEMMNSWKQLLGLPLHTKEIGMIVFGNDHFHSIRKDAKQRILMGTGFSNVVNIALGDIGQTFVARMGTDEVIALHLNSSPNERASMDKQLIFVQDVMEKQFGSMITIGISRQCSSWNEVPHLYKEVKFMMARTRLLEEGQIIHSTRLVESEFQEFRLREEVIPEILHLTETAVDKQKVVSYVSNIFDMLLSQPSVSVSYIQAVAMGLLSELAQKQRWNKELAGEMNLQMWQQLIDSRNTKQIRDTVLDYIYRYMTIETKGKVSQQNSLISEVTNYIEVNFQDHITVKQIAEVHHLNANYLSVLFKKETGKTISDFVLETRMKKAKELLSDPNIKIYEISEQVGLQTSAYFAYLFKKTTGQTPLEYRNNIR